MERLLITKNGALYSSTIAGNSANSLTKREQLDVLQTGSIVWFEKGGVRGTAAGSYTPTPGETHGIFALGMPDDVATRVTPLINIETLKYTKKEPVAAKPQVSIVGGDGVADRTTGSFSTADIGTQFEVTSASSSGDFREGTKALLKDVGTGLPIAANTDLSLGQIVEVIADGAPDAWGTAKLESNLVGSLVIGTKVVGASYSFWITDLEKENWERRTYDVSLTITDPSMTDAALLAAIVAAINADVKVSAIVTAAVTAGNAGISFTSVVDGAKFVVSPQGLLYGSTVVSDGTGLSQVITAGVGTNAQILDLEAKTIGIEGATGTHTGDQRGDIWTVPSLVESGLTYVQYVLTWTDQREVAYVSNNGMPQHKMLNIAVPSVDTTMITAMDNLLGDIIG